ncbi:MAG TPA: arginine deiminase family protein [Steroidobacteraceae bacterium]|nr:arginine deiminase family protein [Steroidobacteraceae bacterium]
MLALVREISPDLARCELSFLERAAIDVARSREQHHAYTAALSALGCSLEWLPPLPQHADGVFVEDAAVVLPEMAVVTRPGVASRRGETASVAAALERYRPLTRIHEPGCLEGGDVLQIGRTLYVGASGRTNAQGIAQLGAALAVLGYRVQAVSMQGCLHLKSACSFIPPDLLLVNPAWVDAGAFTAQRVITVAPSEPWAANTLTVGAGTLVSAAYPDTAERLVAAGVAVRLLDVSELHKAESALTCMSLLLEPAPMQLRPAR